MSQRPLQSSHKRLASYSLLRRTLQTKALLRPARPLGRDGLNDLLDLVGLTVFCFKPVKKGSPPKPGGRFISAIWESELLFNPSGSHSTHVILDISWGKR